MKRADCSSKPRDPAPPTARANSAVRSGSTCSPRARPRSSREVGRGDVYSPSHEGRGEEHAFAQPSPLMRPHPLDHLLDILDRGFLLDAVIVVDNQSATGADFT